MPPTETIHAFVDAINAHNLDRLGELMTDDHTFVDSYGNEVAGRAEMLTGWRGYFEWFPDYQIEVNDIFERDRVRDVWLRWRIVQRKRRSDVASARRLESRGARRSSC